MLKHEFYELTINIAEGQNERGGGNVQLNAIVSQENEVQDVSEINEDSNETPRKIPNITTPVWEHIEKYIIANPVYARWLLARVPLWSSRVVFQL